MSRPKKFSTTIGLMNLISVPFGGFPMCHGAGGLAGQYRYGARTGGANVYAGLIFIILALFFTSPQVLSIIAVGVLGALLVFVGIEMGRHSLKTDSLVDYRGHRDPRAGQFDDGCVYRRDGPCVWYGWMEEASTEKTPVMAWDARSELMILVHLVPDVSEEIDAHLFKSASLNESISRTRIDFVICRLLSRVE